MIGKEPFSNITSCSIQGSSPGVNALGTLLTGGSGVQEQAGELLTLCLPSSSIFRPSRSILKGQDAGGIINHVWHRSSKTLWGWLENEGAMEDEGAERWGDAGMDGRQPPRRKSNSSPSFSKAAESCTTPMGTLFALEKTTATSFLYVSAGLDPGLVVFFIYCCKDGITVTFTV